MHKLESGFECYDYLTEIARLEKVVCSYSPYSSSFSEMNIFLELPNYGDLPVPNILIFPIDTTQPPPQQSFNTSVEDGALAQSYDGKRIAFESHSDEAEEIPSEIWVVHTR